MHRRTCAVQKHTPGIHSRNVRRNLTSISTVGLLHLMLVCGICCGLLYCLDDVFGGLRL